jgi:hypothetical protein
LLELEIPDSAVRVISKWELPRGWDSVEDLSFSRCFGMKWLAASEDLAISVPSVLSGDRNVLINPRHRQFKMVSLIQVEALDCIPSQG